ncbi:uncharacterized protein TM35_000152790 [Trypanosoma theileri]|uniref:Uncharacterized protein n=1 Tax=Trypanosoma theileri TaxID=67003 RepID=A0A1X0NWD2_9TRYP|nr:uncharacterized protein TM35_000152790 [Trypanosoma theileri]ORC88848.1 hypothetical protein TM35_000152790 [Trypanosoma theileri]
MVRYGGPRFEFFFTHQFLNNEQTIRKEDAQRVAAILRRRERVRAAEAAREEEAKQQQLSAEVEGEVPSKSVVEPTEQQQQQSRREVTGKSLTALQKRGLAGTAGCVMFPTARGIPMPEGRGGAPYTPGLDRHRIVPTQLQRTSQRSRAAAGACCPCAALPSVETTERRNAQQRGEEPSGTPAETATSVEEREDAAWVEERSPSVFSHTSSNAPIRALGTQHMNTISTKKEVQDHLRRYGGSMVPPKRGSRTATPFDDMTLPELTTRLVRMQQILH